MRATSDLPELSRAELDVMKELWDHGKLSGREVHELVADRYGWAYTTTRTVLDRLVAKGHLTAEPFHGVKLYVPAISRPEGLARLVRDFADRVLEAEPSAVVALFAAGARLSPGELAELDRLVTKAGGDHD
jgi:BlaI family transcriptional regulator, penicillinase repressor